MRRVVVTGMGAVTPIGLNVEEYWNGLKEGKTGFGEITYFDTTDFKVKIAAEVKGFEPTEYMDRKAAKRMEKFSQYAVAASKEAFAQAGIDMKIHTVWDASSVPVLEACRQSNVNIRKCWIKVLPGSIHFWYL